MAKGKTVDDILDEMEVAANKYKVIDSLLLGIYEYRLREAIKAERKARSDGDAKAKKV